MIVVNGDWANETDSLTTAFLNYVGWGEKYRKVNSTTSRKRQDESALGYQLHDLSYTYQQCTEIGGFLTGVDEPSDTLPIISSLVTLEYAMKDCRTDLNLTGMPDSARLDRYGEYNVSYARLMLVGGEADPVCIHLSPFPKLERHGRS